MPFSAHWFVEGRLCHVEISGTLTEDDIHALDAQLVSLMDSAPDKVILVADVRDLKGLPPMRALTQLRHPRHPKLETDLTVGLTHNPMARFLVSAVAHIVGMSHRDFDSMETARAYADRLIAIPGSHHDN